MVCCVSEETDSELSFAYEVPALESRETVGLVGSGTDVVVVVTTTDLSLGGGGRINSSGWRLRSWEIKLVKL